MPPTTDLPEALAEVLARSRAFGFLGPGPVEDHVRHAHGFAAALDLAGPRAVTGPAAVAPRSAVDLGAGGGVPGLVLAYVWPTTSLVLLDANERRTAFLEDAVDVLGLRLRVEVVRARAEEYARSAARGAAEVVVARGFGPPAVTAECAAPLLAIGGHLVVSEPPDDGGRDQAERWPAEPLGLVGLELRAVVDAGARFAVLEQRAPAGDRWPRRTGVPGKRPLY